MLLRAFHLLGDLEGSQKETAAAEQLTERFFGKYIVTIRNHKLGKHVLNKFFFSSVILISWF